MVYYQVKKEYDNKRRSDGSIYVADELLTAAEVKRYNTPERYIKAVTVSKKKTYFFFGARFADVDQIAA